MTYDQSQIVRNLRGLIGFMPSYDASNVKAKVDETLTRSDSGVYVNYLHPFFTPELLTSVAQRFSGFVVKDWSSTVTYLPGSVVKYQNLHYQCIEQSVTDPPLGSPKWFETTLLSVWFRNVYDAAVLAVLNALKDRNKIDNHGKEFLGRTLLYTSTGVASDAISKSSRFVGFKINLNQDNLGVYVQRIGLQLTEPVANLPVHVITADGVDTTIPLSFNGNNRFTYHDVTINPFLSGNGEVVIGYYEDDLVGSQAIGFGANTVFSQEPCYTCGGLDSNSRRTWDSLISVNPFYRVGNDDTEKNDTNFGLNLVMSFRCDMSDLIIREKYSLVSALQAQLKLMLMEAISKSTRNNQEADDAGVIVYNELREYDDPEHPKRSLNRAITALSYEFSGNSACLRCTSRSGIRITHKVI
jgi:hypothetical protein